MNKRSIATYLAGIAVMVVGGLVSKYLDAAAGALVSGAGGTLIGWLFERPEFAKDA